MNIGFYGLHRNEKIQDEILTTTMTVMLSACDYFGEGTETEAI